MLGLEIEKKPVFDFLKRLFDLLVSFLFMLAFCWFYLLIAVLVALYDRKGHPFFIQDRVGKNGKIFRLYKFRTMCIDAEEKKEDLMAFFFFVFTSPDSNYRVYLAAAVAEEEEQSLGNDEQESDNDSIEVFVGHHDISDIDD